MKTIVNALLNTYWTGLNALNEKVWEGYYRNKAEMLDGLFGEDRIKSRDIEIEKSIFAMRQDVRSSYTRGNLIVSAKNNLIFLNPETLEEPAPYEGYSIYDVFTEDNIINNKLNRCFAIKNTETDKVTKIPAGMKLTKALKHFIPQEKVADLQSKISLILNQKKLTGKLSLSIHAADYLTVSTNNEGWCSCFNLDDGEYRGSVLSLLNSNNTIVAYLESSSNTLNLCDDQKWNSKKWRVYLTLAENNQVVHVGTQYPYRNDDLVVEALKILSDMTGVNYVKRDDLYESFYITTPDTMYNDGRNDFYAVEDYVAPENNIQIEICEDAPICPSCGQHYYRYNDSSSLLCDVCDPEDICCEHCGDYETPGYEYYAEDVGYICRYCYENYYTVCDNCGETVGDDDIVAVENGNGVEYEYCQHCADNRATWCEDCEMYIVNGCMTTRTDSDGNTIACCEKCKEQAEENKEKN